MWCSKGVRSRCDSECAGAFRCLWLLASFGPWTAPLPADTYPRQPGVDALHYIFRLTLSDDTDEIAGEATVDLRFVQDGVADFALDLTSVKDGKGMAVSEVTSAGAPVKFSHQSDRLLITVSPRAKSGERRQFTVRYRGIPAAGLRIGANKYGERTFFSLNWPNLARQWLPMIDHPYDKATSEFLITAPAKYQVVANGLLQEETDLGDGRRFTHWKQSVPIASWLNAIGVAQFAARHFGTAKDVPLETWVFHQDRDAGIVTFEEPVRQAIEFYSDHIGPYPYEKLGNVQAAGLNGGTEHASAIFYGEQSVTGQPGTGIVAHEVAHQWFGDSVTEKGLGRRVVERGFATYFTLLCAEHYQGRDAFVAGLKRSPRLDIHARKSHSRNRRDPRQSFRHEESAEPASFIRRAVGRSTCCAARSARRSSGPASAITTGGIATATPQPPISGRSWKRTPAPTCPGSSSSGWREPGSPVVEGRWRYDPATRRIEIELVPDTTRWGLSVAS